MRKIYLLDDEPGPAESLAGYLHPYGYELQHFSTPASLLQAVAATPPDALMLDLTLGGDIDGGLAVAAALPRGKDGRRAFPMLFLSTRQDFDARLAAVRAGADAFVARPVDVAVLVDRLDHVTDAAPPQPFRIVLIDDDPLMGQLYERALQRAGMEVFQLADPTRALGAIHDHAPDLLITDLNMPQCSGLELAAVLRGHEAMTALPILFLTADDRMINQCGAMNVGSDAFLIKPVSLPDLVGTVRARARRARQLRSLMVRDSLTGALNHAMIKELLVTELARAERAEQPLSFIMVDIDHFKRVNDTYGHPIGDQVIKSLARLLQQQLRRTDYIGRYGGEEFAIIMPRTNAADAYERMERLRQSFATLTHHHEGKGFSATFSCGVAEGIGTTATALSEAADAALYAAKRNGRNQVRLAMPESQAGGLS